MEERPLVKCMNCQKVHKLTKADAAYKCSHPVIACNGYCKKDIEHKCDGLDYNTYRRKDYTYFVVKNL
jgi:hypothetical protein